MGLTALHCAASNGSFYVLQVLLFEDPNGVYAATEMKETPLFYAVRNNHMECVEILLQWGANSEVLNIRKQRPIDFAKSQDMRFILNPTNISSACATQRKYASVLQSDGIFNEACKSIPEIDDPTTERISLSTKTQNCKYFESPGGCVRGDKCFYAHCKEIKNELKGFHFHKAELTRKIFVGGLPPALDSELLSKYFEQFGLVEDAKVIGVHGNEKQSRGFGFVTYVHEKSVAAAVQAHYVCILGKQVEIKSAVPKSLILSEQLQIPAHQPQQAQEQTCSPEPYTPSTPSIDVRITDNSTPKTLSWVDRLLRGQEKTHSTMIRPRDNLSPASVNSYEPAWLRTFKKWLPMYLKVVNAGMGQGQWYALSSVKIDFKTKCGVELDHSSLGYSKLSDFMKSLPGICQIKNVPKGMVGSATHMILLPILEKPTKKLIQQIKKPDAAPLLQPIKISDVQQIKKTDAAPLLQQIKEPDATPLLQSIKMPDVVAPCGNMVDDSDDSKFLEDVLSISYDNIPLIGKNIDSGHQDNVVIQKMPDHPVTIHPRLLQFMKPDSIFHARPWLTNARDVCTDVNCGCVVREQISQQRNLVLEALTRKQHNSFFLRDLDFFEHYEACNAQGKCFACNQRNMVWANFPCQHLLWCSECKGQAIQAAGELEHKCVICNVTVLDFVLYTEIYAPQKEFIPYDHVPYNEIYAPQKESLPYDLLNIRSDAGKIIHPLLGH